MFRATLANMRARKVAESHADAESRLSPAASDRRVPRSPRGRVGLDPKTLLNLPPGDHHDGDGLVLRVFPSGARAWMLRYRPKVGDRRGKQRRLRLGDLGGPLALDVDALGLGRSFKAPASLTLGAARDVARALLGLAARGVDPLTLLTEAAERRRAAEAEILRRKAERTFTLDMLLEQFLDARRESVRPNTLALWESLARSELRPAFGSRDPRELSRADVKAWHRAIGESGRRVWANRALELIAGLYRWAVEEELLPSSPVVNIRPFEERARDRVLSSDEIKAVWEALAFEPFGDAFRLLFWTAARRSEVIGSTWAEVDLRAKLWRISAERSKTGQPRTIPLVAPALALMEARRAADPRGRWIFASPVRAVGPLRSLQAPFRRVVARSGVTGWTVHDIRRTVRSNLAALGVRPDIAEAVLGHVRPALERVYNVHEPVPQMRAALEAWQRRLARIVSGEPEAADVAVFPGTTRR
jgi:integrase